MPSRVAAALLVGILAGAAWVALNARPNQPPAAVGASAPAAAFSAERARRHLREITRQPRPLGSSAHAATRAYLIQNLREMGLETQVQTATALHRTGDTLNAAHVANIVARLPGVQPSGRVLLVAHYDSVPHSPGAGDAGNGVAAILETVRALQSGPRLDNDVLVLLTDAEEPGLLGARAFVADHPGYAEAAVVLNAEGRGHRGPVAMFRTTPDNGRLIRTLAAAVPGALAESMTNEAFRHMPNDTDLSVFAEAGYAGLDFANAHGFTHYHMALDTFEAASVRTLQHHGDYLLALARAFGQADLEGLAAPERVYFSLPVLGLMHYPAAWALPLVLSMLAVFVRAGQAVRRGSGTRLRHAVPGLVHLLAALFLLPLLATAAWRLMSRLVPETGWFQDGRVYDSEYYLLGLCLLAAAAYAASLEWVDRRAGRRGAALAPIVLWGLLAFAAALAVPGAGYLFLWPAITAAGAGWLLQLRAGDNGLIRGTVLAIAGAAIVLLVLPAVEAVGTMFPLGAVAVPIALLVLTLGLLVPQLRLLGRTTGQLVPVLLAVGGFAVLAVALSTTGFDRAQRKPNSLNYIADADANEAWWYSLDRELDAWTGQYLGPEPQRARLPDWAPEHPFGFTQVPWVRRAREVLSDAPDVEVLEESLDGSGHRLRLRLTSPAGAYVTVIEFVGDTRVEDLRVGGRQPPQDGAHEEALARIYYYGIPAEGTELAFTLPAGSRVSLYLRANVPGLPRSEETANGARAPHMMPASSRWSDMTQLQRRVELLSTGGTIRRR